MARALRKKRRRKKERVWRRAPARSVRVREGMPARAGTAMRRSVGRSAREGPFLACGIEGILTRHSPCAMIGAVLACALAGSDGVPSEVAGTRLTGGTPVPPPFTGGAPVLRGARRGLGYPEGVEVGGRGRVDQPELAAEVALFVAGEAVGGAGAEGAGAVDDEAGAVGGLDGDAGGAEEHGDASGEGERVHDGTDYLRELGRWILEAEGVFVILGLAR